jgi:hypothetical protein
VGERIRVRSTQSELSRLAVFYTEILPVKQRAETLNSISLIDALAASFLSELKHVLGELVDGIFDRLHATIDDITALFLGSFNQILQEAAEAG